MQLDASYRLSCGIRGGTAILFNHESPLRPERFVTQKIVYGARSFASGEIPVLKLGDLDVIRDWGGGGTLRGGDGQNA